MFHFHSASPKLNIIYFVNFSIDSVTYALFLNAKSIITERYLSIIPNITKILKKPKDKNNIIVVQPETGEPY